MNLRAVLAVAALWLAGSAFAAGVADPIDRAAVAVRQIERSVLLDVASAGSRLVAVGEHGVVALSDDAARTWRQARAVPVSVSLTAVRFADAVHGWAVGHAGVVLRTDDGGEHWAKQLDGSAAARLVIDGAMAKSPADPKAVQAAQRLVADGADKPWLDLLAIDAHRAVLVGAYGLAMATDDGGQTWQPWAARLDNPKGLHLYAIVASCDTLYIVGEQGLVLRSTDGGQHFTPLVLPYKGSWFAIAASANGSVVIAGLRGHAAISSDGGEHWQALEGAAPISFVTATPTLLVNQAGQAYGVSAGSSALQPIAMRPLPPLHKLMDLPDGDWLALTALGAQRVGRPDDATAATVVGTGAKP